MSESRQQAESNAATTKKNLQTIQQQRREQQGQEQYKAELAAKLGTRIGQTKKNIYDNLAEISKVTKGETSIRTSQAKTYAKIQDNLNTQLKNTIKTLQDNPTKYTIDGKKITGSVIDGLKEELKEGETNYYKLQEAVASGKESSKAYTKYIKQLQSQSLKPQIKKELIYKTSPNKNLEALKDMYPTPNPTELQKQELLKKNPYMARYIDPKYKYENIIQKFYNKSNYPSKAEMVAALQEKGLAAKEDFKPKTFGEAYNRFAYAVTETIGGGIREATLGLTGSMGVENRPGGILYQVAGGIATPTVADMAASHIVGKAMQTRTGQAVLKRFYKLKGTITAPEKLTARQIDELEQLFKVKDADYWKTKEGMELLEQLNKRVTHYIENPEYYASGAAVIPEDVYIYQTLPPEVKPSVYEQFITKYGDKVGLSTAVIASMIVNTSPKQAQEILNKTGDVQVVVIKSVPRSIEAALEKPRSIPVQSVIAVQSSKVEPIQETVQKQEAKLKTTQITDIEPMEEIIPEPDIPDEQETPKLDLPKRDMQARRELNFKLFNGKNTKYRVQYHYQSGKPDTVIVEARSLNEGLNRAQRIKKPNKNRANIIDIEELKN